MCTRDFSRALSKLQVINWDSDWLIALFAPVVIDESNYFGIAFSTVIWKPRFFMLLLFIWRQINVLINHIVAPHRCRSRSGTLCLNIFCIYLKESNQLHAVCQDTYPPITPPYMNPTSHRIVQLVTEYNNFYGFPKVFCNSSYYQVNFV